MTKYRTKLMIYYSHKHKIRFLAIPKNASTSVRQRLDINLSLDWYEYEWGERAEGWEHVKAYPLFAVVRNPVKRWASQVRYIANIMNIPNTDTVLSLWRSMVDDGQDPVMINNHFETQVRYFDGPEVDWVITMDDLNAVFPGLHQSNTTNRQRMVQLPDDVAEYYGEDFILWNEHKMKDRQQTCKDLARYINTQIRRLS